MMDLHTHLDLYPNALSLLDEVNNRNYFTLSVTTSPMAWLSTSKIFSGKNRIVVALGLHPEIVEQKRGEVGLLLDLIGGTKYIGEVGLDGSPQHSQTYGLQRDVFKNVLRRSAAAGGRVISVHSRGAASEVLSILAENPHAGRVVLHWFSGNGTELMRAINLGCYFSVNLLMATSKKGAEIIARIPKNRLLPESDGPFACWQGSPLSPFSSDETASAIARIWGTDVDFVLTSFDETLRELRKGL